MDAEDNLAGPHFVRYFGPVLRALQALGGSARPAEVCANVADKLGVSEEAQAEELPSGQRRFDNQVAWARFYLVRAAFIDSSRRGVWTLTDEGSKRLHMDHTEAHDLFKRIHSVFQTEKAAKEEQVRDELEEEDSSPPEESQGLSTDHRQALHEVLMSLSPGGFERFSQRLLRESGFQEVTVTGRSGDGGIDGIGILEVNPLVSFKVLFQCKRFKGTVAATVVRDFRGAMEGRADKGIIITTGKFSADAKKEAVRAGAKPIELVDSDKLITMLENLELGLEPVRSFRIDDSFFEDFRT